ncbi:MAG: hypothetical protein LAO06_00450 [Acidobacteriia bacterium]|nr:hypothetical protein [Terriglobia bacterium]
MARLGTNGAAVRVLVADATPTGSELIVEALRQDSRFDVVGVLTSADQFAALVSDLTPDVTVVGVSADGARRGFALLRHRLARYPGVKPVFLLDSSTPELVIGAFWAGARGVICRGDGIEALRKCIYVVHQGQVWASSAQLGFVLDAFSRR